MPVGKVTFNDLVGEIDILEELLQPRLSVTLTV
jgi:hypothetical protein